MCRAVFRLVLSYEFEVKVGVDQGSVLSPLLIIVCHGSFELEYLGGPLCR